MEVKQHRCIQTLRDHDLCTWHTMVGMVANYTWLRLTPSYYKEVLNKRELLKNILYIYACTNTHTKKGRFPSQR